jgi:hypothetical protein
VELLILVVPLLWAAAVQISGELADKRAQEREQEVLLLARRRAFEMCRDVLDRPTVDSKSASATWYATRCLVESIDHALANPQP